jgi:hypothetical protein
MKDRDYAFWNLILFIWCCINISIYTIDYLIYEKELLHLFSIGIFSILAFTDILGFLSALLRMRNCFTPKKSQYIIENYQMMHMTTQGVFCVGVPFSLALTYVLIPINLSKLIFIYSIIEICIIGGVPILFCIFHGVKCLICME